MTIEDRLHRQPEPWKPNPGEQLIGTVIDIENHTSEYGAYPVVTIETDDGHERLFHAFHTVARTEIERKHPSNGDRIGVLYRGRSADKAYEQYRIVIERQGPTCDPLIS